MDEMERFFLPAYLPYLTDPSFNGANDPTRIAVTGAQEHILFWEIDPKPREF